MRRAGGASCLAYANLQPIVPTLKDMESVKRAGVILTWSAQTKVTRRSRSSAWSVPEHPNGDSMSPPGNKHGRAIYRK
jgi:hypothetical protein